MRTRSRRSKASTARLLKPAVAAKLTVKAASAMAAAAAASALSSENSSCFPNPNRDHCYTGCSSSDDADDMKEAMAEVEEENNSCSTPKAKEFRVPSPASCPPAPRKKRSVCGSVLRLRFLLDAS